MCSSGIPSDARGVGLTEYLLPTLKRTLLGSTGAGVVAVEVDAVDLAFGTPAEVDAATGFDEAQELEACFGGAGRALSG